MIRKSICQESVTILNIYAPKNLSKQMKQKLIELKGERQFNNNSRFQGPVSIMDRITRQKIKEIEDLNEIHTLPSTWNIPKGRPYARPKKLVNDGWMDGWMNICQTQTREKSKG